MPTLYIVATPIGNLEDISLRALRVLKEVGLIAAEDTRKTRFLLNKYEIKTPATSYHEHNKLTKLSYVLGKLETEDVALVSEAGMPGISDPGYELVVAAIERGITVVPIPGPSAIIAALAVSGLPTDRFLFVGFLPARTANRRRTLENIATEKATLIFYEAPHRVIATLKDMLATLGDRRIAVCRELTKIHEEVFRGTISQAIEHFATPRGEFTLVIEGSKAEAKPVPTEDIEKRMLEMRHAKLSASEAVRRLSGETGLSRRELYRLWIGQK
jgi:16S rRNA (cytidine1402-2'-O)-methyltransferase